MKVATFHFNWAANNDFDRMLRVLVYSATQAGLPIDVVTLGTFDVGKREFKTDNTYKMRAWNAYVQEQENGTNLLLIDSDTEILESPAIVFEKGFDLAFTIRTSENRPNTGVVFVRVNERTKAFFQKWHDVQNEMYYNINKYIDLFRQYRGLNQTALMYCRQNGYADGLQIIELPCNMYNACTDDHRSPRPTKQYIVHYHYGDLRQEILRKPSKMRSHYLLVQNNTARYNRLLRRAEHWRDMEKRAESIDITPHIYTLQTEIIADEHTRPDSPARTAWGRDRARQTNRPSKNGRNNRKTEAAKRLEASRRGNPFRLTRQGG